MDETCSSSSSASRPPSPRFEADDLDLMGVSVHHLGHVFLPEVLNAGHGRNSKFFSFLRRVLKAGHTRSSTLHDIEPLEEGTNSVIRSKGADKVSPVDGKVGASYVHSLGGEDRVGKATFMLSYSWNYRIGDIVDTLNDYCSSRQLDPKRTYVWICCLCVNQHRVLQLKNDQKKSGMAADTKVDFFGNIGNIGSVLDDQGKYEEALVEYRKALAIDESALGKDHPNTATTYNNIGWVLANQGRYEAALVEYRKSLRIRETVLGKDHPRTKGTKKNMDIVNKRLSE